MPKDPGPQTWQPGFYRDAPLFAPLGAIAAALDGPDWPTHAALQPRNPIRSGGGKPLRFVEHGPKASCFAEQYEPRIYLSGEVPTRSQNWHDFFNALAWLAFPRAKAAINAAHYQAALTQEPGSNRHPARHKLTLFDESGVAVACTDPRLAELLRNHRWRELFVERRQEVRQAMAFYVFGHSLYEKGLAPYVGLTGHGLILATDGIPTGAELDALLAERLAEPAGLAFTPVPLLGIPDWWPANENPAFYDNLGYFRPRRQ